MDESESVEIIDEEEESEVELEGDEEEEEKTDIIRQVIIRGDYRITPNIINYFEYVQVICTRVEQILAKGETYVPLRDSAAETAIQEIQEKKCPLSIGRTILLDRAEGVEYREEWAVNELEILPKCISRLEELVRAKPFDFDEEIAKILK